MAGIFISTSSIIHRPLTVLIRAAKTPLIDPLSLPTAIETQCTGEASHSLLLSADCIMYLPIVCQLYLLTYVGFNATSIVTYTVLVVQWRGFAKPLPGHRTDVLLRTGNGP